MQFLSYQIERVEHMELSETTIPNYYKAAKLFCEMNDLLYWKKISRMSPHVTYRPFLERIVRLLFE